MKTTQQTNVFVLELAHMPCAICGIIWIVEYGMFFAGWQKNIEPRFFEIFVFQKRVFIILDIIHQYQFSQFGKYPSANIVNRVFLAIHHYGNMYIIKSLTNRYASFANASKHNNSWCNKTKRVHIISLYWANYLYCFY